MATVESTRSRILNAAIEMMDVGGESSVRLGAIAEALGITLANGVAAMKAALQG